MNFALTLAMALALAAPEETAPPAPATAPADAAAAPAAPASAPEAKVRAVVHLRDGGLVRGTVKKMRLGKSITLRLSSGKSITLDDEDVIEIQIYGRGAPAEAGAGSSEPAGAKGETFPEQPISAPKAASAWPGAAAGKPTAAPGSAAAASKPSGASPAARPAILPQPSPGSGVDTVYLEGGGLLRGTVESEKPDLVIRLVSGRKRTVPAASVQRIDRGKKP